MSIVGRNRGATSAAVLPDFLLPMVMAAHVVRHRALRAQAAARADGGGERGALSIELALLVIVLIAAAGLVVVAITKLVTSKANQIGNTP